MTVAGDWGLGDAGRLRRGVRRWGLGAFALALLVPCGPTEAEHNVRDAARSLVPVVSSVGRTVDAPAASSVGVPLAQQPVSDVTRNPLAANPAAVADGQRVYNRTCQACNGTAGQGDRAPALTTTRFVHGNDDADVFHTIRSGIPGTQMPPFGGLRDEEIWQLVTYIRTLQSTAPS